MPRRVSVGKRLTKDEVEKRGIDALFNPNIRNSKLAESSYVVILITAGSYEEAHSIADALVSQRKAACVNIVPKGNSLFRWGDKVEEAEESLLLVKTRAELFPEAVNLVRGINSYELSEITALPVVEGNSDYLAWISKETETRSKIRITVGELEVEAWLNETNIGTKVLEIPLS